MLLPLLVNFWWCPFMVVDSWPCSYEQVVHSTASYHFRTHLRGLILTFTDDDPYILNHPCGTIFSGEFAPALYLGKKVFFSFDKFDSSLLPLTIPRFLAASPAVVSAAVFVQFSRFLIVINREVFVYFYIKWKVWIRSKGITKPVTAVANDHCCYAGREPSCDKISRFVLAFDAGNWASKTEIFYSNDGGFSFYPVESRPLDDGIVLGMYNFASSQEIGMLLKTANNSRITYFAYGHPYFYTNDKGTPFNLEYLNNYRVKSMVPPGLRGFVVIWTTEIFMSSPNHGYTIEPITVLPTNSYPHTSLPTKNKTVCSMAATASEIVAITRSQLFYGSLDVVSSQMVHLAGKNTSTLNDSCDAMIFEDIGTISIIHPLPSTVSSYYHFHKCKINIQATLMSLGTVLKPCPVQQLNGNFHNKMFYIDIKEMLYLNATFIPKPGSGAQLFVTVSNPHVLAFEARIVESGTTLDRSSIFSLKLMLEEQKLIEMIHKPQNISISSKLSSVTVDIYNKGIFCIDMHPLTALIALTCPPNKHIKILKTATACSTGLFEPRQLENLFYLIDKKLYDPAFLGKKDLNQEDLNVTYDYNKWECPILLYYDKPWLPVLELWEYNRFLKYVSADFVLYEIHGMHNYDYLLTEVQANCLSKAQSWTTLLNDSKADPDSAWTNYVSCKKRRGNDALPSASRKYQILNINEKNRINFKQYRGFYVFRAIVVDPFYSYCKFTTTFSVYVYGALPKSEINAGKALISFLVLIFGTILMVYYFPKLLKENARMKF